MNKRAIIKFSILGIFFSFVILFYIFSQLASSSASTEKVNSYYNLGEKVKIDFDESYGYTLKATYPDGKSSIKKGTAQSILFEPTSLGKYSLYIYYGGKSKRMDFEVVNFVENATSAGDVSSNPFGNYVRYEYTTNSPNYTNESNIVIGRDVLWKNSYTLGSDRQLEFSVPKYASQIKMKNNGVDRSYSEKTGIAYSIQNFIGSQENKSYVVDASSGLVEVEYYTPGPQRTEKQISSSRKEVVVYDSNEVGYTNVLAYTQLDDSVSMNDKSAIKVYWKEEGKYLDFNSRDADADGFIDNIEWIVPHLSNQTFEIIIEIIRAAHLDSGRNYIGDIYNSVSKLDGIYSPEINAEEYVRVSFEQNLTNQNDITLVPNLISGNPTIEVYEKDASQLLTVFEGLAFNRPNKVFLTNLRNSQDTFDLKVIGGVLQFDYIVDPTTLTSSPQSYTGGTNWNNITGAYADGGNAAYTTSATVPTVTYYNYSFSIPSGSTINQVRVRSDYRIQDNNDYFTMAVSWNGGTSWSSEYTLANSQTETTVWTNVTSATMWTNVSLDNTNFRIRYTPVKSSGASTWYIDWAQAEVVYSYTPPAGVLSVILNKPDDLFSTNNRTISFNYTPISSASLLNCSLWDNSTGTFALNISNQTSVTNGSVNFLNKTFSSDGVFKWNVQCCDSSGCAFDVANRTVSIDSAVPLINLVSPLNNSNIADIFDLFFVYNVSDTMSSIANCSLLINGASVQTQTVVAEDLNQTFNYYAASGINTWQVSCTDFLGNIGTSELRTINISILQNAFSNVFWVTGTTDYTSNQPSNDYLSNTRDTSSNSASFSVGATSLVNLGNATSSLVGQNGALIPSGSPVTFSSAFSTSSSNVKITWKLYITNSSGDYLLCRIGDDAGGGISCAATSSTTNTTCINRDVRLQTSDRLKLVTDGYNSAGSSRNIVYVWDDPYDSFVNINVTSEGFLDVNLTYPTSLYSVPQNEVLNATCTVNCTVGYCRNTTVYLQQNTSLSNWVNINSTSGNLILNTAETNPHSLGNVITNAVSTNFSIKGNILSSSNIRCIAISNYDAENGTFFAQVDVGGVSVTAPVVEITSPINLTWFNGTAVLYYNISDVNNNLANSTLIIDGQRNISNQTILINNAINNYTINLPDGFYNWTVNASDTTNLEGMGNETRTFYVDTEVPSINLHYPVNLDIFYVSSVLFNFTIMDNMDSNLTCNLTVDGVNRYTNFGADNNTVTNKTVTGLTIGDHMWNVSCVDNALNYNISETRNFTVIDLAPVVILTTSNASFFNTSTISLIYNASDNNGITNTYLILNGVVNQSNQTEVINGELSNFTITLSDGSYNWIVNATDTNGLNSTNTTKFFTVDTQIPFVNLNLPTNLTTSSNSSYSFNFTTIDNLDLNLRCNLTINGTSTAVNASNSSLTNKLMSNLTDGINLWNVTCIDDANNTNTSETRQITIAEYPTINLTVGNNSFFNYTNVNLTFIPRDNTNLSVCSLYLNGVFNQSNQTAVSNGVSNKFQMNFSEGAYNWYVNCTDMYGLTNISETKYFTIDINKMNITLFYPNPGEEIYSSSINFSYLVTDNSDLYLDCNITVNGQKVDNYTAQNGTVINRSVGFAVGGLKFWNVTCKDDSGNIEVSETRNFTLAFAPIINITLPVNATWFNTSIINFSYYIEDNNDNIVNSTLILNGLRNITNQTPIANYGVNNFSVELSEGRYNWTVNSTDTTNLESTGNTTRVIYVDFHAPQIVINLPNNSQLLDWNNVTFNFSVSDNLDSTVLCNLTVNSSNSYDEITGIIMNNGIPTVYYLSKSDGYYNWFLTCSDRAGNVNQTSERVFTIDAPPRVTNLDPSNNQYFNASSITFTYLPEDVFGIYNCSLYIDGIFNETDTTITKNQNNSISVDGIMDGRHNWSVECYDSAPDFNSVFSNTTNFYIDLTPPLMVLNSPSNDSGLYRNQSYLRWYFNFTATDLLDNNLRCNVTLDGINNKTNLIITSGFAYSDYILGLSQGYHNWSVSCKDTVNNLNVSQVFFFNYTYPDFMVNSSLISLNNSQPKENESVLITATISNFGGVDGTNVLTRFYKGDPDSGGVQIGSDQRINISKNNQTNISQIWSGSLGTSNLYFVVDHPTSTNGSFYEWNESNNKAFQIGTVGGWEFFSGVVNSGSEFALADNSSKRLINWSSDSFAQGNIYVTDYESSVSWPELLAISKTKTGTDSSNDFAEIDTSLSMSSFTDSVYNTFTNSGTPKDTRSIIIFNHAINSVPTVNSTNNTNFVTGILWDSSKSADNEYDSTEKEDLVFVATINKSQQGAYGIYDYEARIPAKLRDYKTTDTQRVVFYVELV